ncbi:MAG: hypothetical protein QXF87_07895 [Thermofilaceae archaeon]
MWRRGLLRVILLPYKSRRVHISLPSTLYQKARERARQLGCRSFSEYVHQLILQDVYQR